VRRSHRLALSALVAFAVLVAAGRLATSAIARGERTTRAQRARIADDATNAAVLRAAPRSNASRFGDGGGAIAAAAPSAPGGR
jgi:hypothetical protein